MKCVVYLSFMLYMVNKFEEPYWWNLSGSWCHQGISIHGINLFHTEYSIFITQLVVYYIVCNIIFHNITASINRSLSLPMNVIKWKHFLHYWPFVWGIHRSPVNSLHKGQWCRAFFLLIYAWINGWVNNHEAGDLRCYCAHYNVTIIPWFQSGERLI